MRKMNVVEPVGKAKRVEEMKHTTVTVRTERLR